MADMKWRAAIWLGALILVGGTGCATTPAPPSASHGVPAAGDAEIGRHVIRPGENLYRLSLYYGVPVERIARANAIRQETALQVGQVLDIPGAGKAQPAHSLAPGGAASAKASPSAARSSPRQAIRDARVEFRWPVSGRVSSGFGQRGTNRHEGLDILAPRGVEVRAAESGRVVYSGQLGDYGNVVIIKHAGPFSTVYAHNQSNRVREDQFVEQGDVVATVGRTGNASTEHLHFELRRDRIAEDPLAYLPDTRLAER